MGGTVLRIDRVCGFWERDAKPFACKTGGVDHEQRDKHRGVEKRGWPGWPGWAMDG